MALQVFISGVEQKKNKDYTVRGGVIAFINQVGSGLKFYKPKIQDMPITKSSVIIIHTKDKRFRVRYYAANGEMLAVSEVLNTRANANKNIKAMTLLFMRGDVKIVDTTKVVKSWPE